MLGVLGSHETWAGLGSRSLAVVIGGVVPLVGFTPLNHAADVLGIEANPWRVALMPPVLLAVVAVVASFVLPRRAAAWPSWMKAAGLAFILACALSLVASDKPQSSALVFVVSILAPAVLMVSISRIVLPVETMCASFLAVTCGLLLRDDWVFARQYGFPTGTTLFHAKFSNVPYDFHYYGLQNPDGFATFILIPLALSAFWAVTADVTSGARALLAVSTVIAATSLLLAYARFDLLVGLAIIVGAITMAPTSKRARLLVGGSVIALAVGFAISGSNASYIANLTSTNNSASTVIRGRSIVDGITVMARHPLTGVGLDRYGAISGTPAHSAIAQAGAELGVLGLLSLTLLVVGLVRGAWLSAARRPWSSVSVAASLGAGIYAICTSVSAGARLGLLMDFVPIWGLSIAVLVAASQASGAAHWRPQVERADEVLVSAGARGAGSIVRVRPAAAVVALATLVAAVGITTLRDPPASVSRATEASLAGRVPLSMPPKQGWLFAGGVASGWRIVVHVRVIADPGGLQVSTGGPPLGYQLLGPLVSLIPGRYLLRVTASVRTGEMVPGVLDVDSQSFIAEFPFGAHRRLTTRTEVFTVNRPMTAEIILSDERRPPATHSRWFLRQVNITHLTITHKPPRLGGSGAR